MAEVTERDDKLLEINDYTTPTDWELFISELEEALHEWEALNTTRNHQLKKGDFMNGIWKEVSDNVSYEGLRLVFTYHWLIVDDCDDPEMCQRNTKLKTDHSQTKYDLFTQLPTALTDLSSMENDFPIGAHCLGQWFGLREFAILSPVSDNDIIVTDSKIKMLLSSLCIALSNTNSEIPMFVQVQEKWKRMYVGLCCTSEVRADFEMIYMKRIQLKYNHLSGLKSLFNDRLTNGPIRKWMTSPVVLSVRFTYVSKSDNLTAFPHDFPDFNYVTSDLSPIYLRKLPFGAVNDPVSEIHLLTTWPAVAESLVIENDVHSDLNPINAPKWSIRIKMGDDPDCLMAGYLLEFADICHKSQASWKWRSDNLEKSDSAAVKALDRLADRSSVTSRVTSFVSRARRYRSSFRSKSPRTQEVPPDEGPIPTEALTDILYNLFPDAIEAATGVQQTKLPNYEMEDNSELPDKFKCLSDKLSQFKSCAEWTLLSQLAVNLCCVNKSYLGLQAVNQLWQEFVLEMRYRWENGFKIPRLESGLPKLNRSLLYQKLQLLNCCIDRKVSREHASSQPRRASLGSLSRLSIETDDDEDDEFFECNESIPEEDIVADGRLMAFGDLKLFGTTRQMFVPITQEPNPMTEDQLDQHTEALLSLGDCSEGAQLRAKLQSTCLLSDMQSFKAANPGCKLDDFVRWYSPRDFENDQLSARMQLPGNTWQCVWQSAKAIPARKQKRLFDDTREAEKVLHYLTAFKPTDVVLNLMPMVIQNALLTVARNDEESVAKLPALLEQIAGKVAKITNMKTPDIAYYEDIIQQIRLAEVLVARAKSLRLKFGSSVADENRAEVCAFVKDVMDKQEVDIPGGSQGLIGQMLVRIFTGLETSEFRDSNGSQSNYFNDMPQPVSREYIIRCEAKEENCRTTPQRFHCTLAEDLRICAVTSKDTAYFWK